MHKPSQLLSSVFSFPPTGGQLQVFDLLDSFLADRQRTRKVFLLKGYAGTGKTSIIGALTDILSDLNLKFVLLASTGRAAKMVSAYSGKKAHTIHKHIYTKEEGEDGLDEPRFVLKTNLAGKTIYIVDEASMISDEAGWGANGLLADLMEFVFARKSNRLILVGDMAQLPPVRQSESPALSGEYLREKFDADLVEFELTEVVRQERKSGILENATYIREVIRQNGTTVKLEVQGFRDFYRMKADKLEDGLNYAYGKYGIHNTMVITRSNKSAVLYNQYIRSRINYAEEELQVGDMLIVVRNNYETLPEEISGGFLANGDFVEIVKVRRTTEMHGFRFADVLLKLPDEAGEPEFEARILLDLLNSYSPSLSQEENHRLYTSVSKDYWEIKNKRERRAAIKKDAFLSALQVKYAYALTCHKAQGGQWDAVFIDQGYLTQDQIDREYYRWLYTAVTRGTKEVFMVNFDAQFFR